MVRPTEPGVLTAPLSLLMTYRRLRVVCSIWGQAQGWSLNEKERDKRVYQGPGVTSTADRRRT